jgi:RND family efflux transporter MFP subunit
MTRLPRYVPSAILVALVIGFAAACKRKPPEPDGDASGEARTLVLSQRDVAQVVSQPVLAGVRVVGTLNPAITVDIKARMSEELEALYAERGTVVTQGQVMARLDARGPLTELNRNRAQLSAAERDFRAAEILFKGGAMSERNYANARVAVENAKAQTAEAELTFDHATVRSPVNGVVSDRAVSPGEAVSPGQRLFTVVNSEYLECFVSVLPTDVVSVREGQRALLQVAAYDRRQLEGRVQRIDPLADSKSRRVGVYIRVPNQEGTVVAGLFCIGTILTNVAAAEQDALLLPSGAARTEDGKSVVYIVEEGRLRRTPVELRAEENLEGLVEVASGVSAGQTVVVAQTQQLTNGMPVKVTSEPARP